MTLFIRLSQWVLHKGFTIKRKLILPHDKAKLLISPYNQRKIHISVAQFQKEKFTTTFIHIIKNDIKIVANTWRIRSSWIYMKQPILHPLVMLPFHIKTMIITLSPNVINIKTNEFYEINQYTKKSSTEPDVSCTIKNPGKYSLVSILTSNVSTHRTNKLIWSCNSHVGYNQG